MKIRVRVTPGAKESKIVSYEEHLLRVRVTAPPEKGKANTAVRKLLADILGVPATEVTIIHGQTSKNKVVEIPNMTEDKIRIVLKQNRTLL